jgi:hypothetical protein
MEEVVMAVLAVLPPEHRKTAEAALAAMAALAIALVPLKWLAVKYTPTNLRPWVDAVFKVLDMIAVNTRGVHTLPSKPEKKP